MFKITDKWLGFTFALILISLAGLTLVLTIISRTERCADIWIDLGNYRLQPPLKSMDIPEPLKGDQQIDLFDLHFHLPQEYAATLVTIDRDHKYQHTILRITQQKGPHGQYELRKVNDLIAIIDDEMSLDDDSVWRSAKKWYSEKKWRKDIEAFVKRYATDLDLYRAAYTVLPTDLESARSTSEKSNVLMLLILKDAFVFPATEVRLPNMTLFLKTYNSARMSVEVFDTEGRVRLRLSFKQIEGDSENNSETLCKLLYHATLEKNVSSHEDR